MKINATLSGDCQVLTIVATSHDGKHQKKMIFDIDEYPHIEYFEYRDELHELELSFDGVEYRLYIDQKQTSLN